MELAEYKLSAPKEVLVVGQSLQAVLTATAKALPDEFKTEVIKSAMGVVNPIMEGVDAIMKAKKA